MEKHLAEKGKETCMGDSDSQVPRAEHVWASEASYVTIAFKTPSTQTKSHPQDKGARLHCEPSVLSASLQVLSSAWEGLVPSFCRENPTPGVECQRKENGEKNLKWLMFSQ